MHLILFAIFATICAAGAINLVAQRHPINSALSLIVVMGSLAVLYLLLGAEFVAAIQLIVYAGAIMVLFVFVIMLLNAGEEERTRGRRLAVALGVPGLIVVAGILLYVLSERNPHAQPIPLGGLYGPPIDIGRELFRHFLLPFEVTSILILIAILGAVLLARETRTGRQHPSRLRSSQALQRPQVFRPAPTPDRSGLEKEKATL